MQVTLPGSAYYKTDDRHSQIGEYSRNSLLSSARDLFAGETSPIRLGCVASVSALESGSESKENGSRERGRGEKVPFYLLPIPLSFSIQFFNLLFFGPLVQLMT